MRSTAMLSLKLFLRNHRHRPQRPAAAAGDFHRQRDDNDLSLTDKVNAQYVELVQED
jgi:hypothetical protein